MEVSRRDFQVLQERVGRLESKIHAIEQRLATLDNLLKPENLVRRVRQGEQEEKRRVEREGWHPVPTRQGGEVRGGGDHPRHEHPHHGPRHE